MISTMSPASTTVLIVEDEPKLASLLEEYLQRAGFHSHWLDSAREVVATVQQASPSLILLDLMLPDGDGMELCREIRGFSQVPIIMVTARIEEIDRLLGLELGADDYICKPYSPREVVARVRAVLRRTQPTPETPSAGLALDHDGYQASLDGSTLDLTPVEFRLLAALADQPGRVLSRDRLLDRLYADHRVVSDRTVDSHVKNLRRKLQLIRPDQDPIRSVYGVGYRLEFG